MVGSEADHLNPGLLLQRTKINLGPALGDLVAGLRNAEGPDGATSNSDGSRRQQESGAERDHCKAGPVRFDSEARGRS
ncbi:hypothetical protein [Bradyrhizobium sp.]|uniref:hypothetical protein n=1 Tax=Bradyrhizobium sp. TaxID=376 RepID=UPI004037BB3E